MKYVFVDESWEDYVILATDKKNPKTDQHTPKRHFK